MAVTRRSLVGGMLAGLGVPALGGCATIPGESRTGLDQIADVIRANDFTFLGDPDHSKKLTLNEFLSGKPFLARAYRAGARRLDMEIPVWVEPDLEDLYTGKIPLDRFKDLFGHKVNLYRLSSEEERKKYTESFCTLAVNSRRAGIPLCFVDNYNNNDIKTPFMIFFEKKYSKIIDGLEGPKLDEFISRHAGEVLQYRTDLVIKRSGKNANGPIMDRILENQPSGRGLINFGIDHAAAMHDLLAERGKRMTVVILHASPEGMYENFRGVGSMPWIDMGAYNHFVISTGQFLPAERPMPDVALRSLPPLSPVPGTGLRKNAP